MKIKTTPIIGDIHGKWHRVNKIIGHESEQNDDCLSTGDLGNYRFSPKSNQRLVFSHGNHESFSYIEELLKSRQQNLIALNPGEVFVLRNGLGVTAFPGVYSPRFFESEGNIKYFSKCDLDKVLGVEVDIDVLITHEPPRGVGIEKEGSDLGNSYINRIMKHLRPKITFSGHHHLFLDGDYDGLRVVSLDLPHRSYVRTNPLDHSIEKVEAKLINQRYQYEWEN
jgi:Icc-related predicted phosphoesterase